MALTLTERQADIWRTAAAIIYGAARGECDDLPTLMLREGDQRYHGEVAACVCAAFIEAARRRGIDNRLIDEARMSFRWTNRPADEQQAVEAAHRFAHAVAAIGIAYHGPDEAIARTHLVVEQFAVGDYGPGIEVE
jgi:hypothetical protein